MVLIKVNGQSLTGVTENAGSVTVHGFTGGSPGSSVNNICPMQTYSIKVNGVTFNKNGKPYLFRPSGIHNSIVRGVPFEATIFHGNDPVEVVSLSLDGSDMKLVMGKCPDCPCISGKICTSTGDCIYPSKKCSENSVCRGRCRGFCPDTGICAGREGEYTCVYNHRNEWVPVFIFVAAVVLILAVLNEIRSSYGEFRYDVEPIPVKRSIADQNYLV